MHGPTYGIMHTTTCDRGHAYLDLSCSHKEATKKHRLLILSISP